MTGLRYYYRESNPMQMDRDNMKLWDARAILGGGLI